MERASTTGTGLLPATPAQATGSTDAGGSASGHATQSGEPSGESAGEASGEPAGEPVGDGGLTPLAFMLALMRDPEASLDNRKWAAQQAAPYLHARKGTGDAPAAPTGHEQALEDDAGASQELSRLWGARTEANRTRALDYARRIGGDDTADWLADSGLDRHPRLLSLLHAAAQASSEDTPGDMRASSAPDGGRDGFVRDAGSARQEIARLQADPTFRSAYTDAFNPAHDDSVRRMERLFRAAYGAA
ncbi:MAG: hypothetical protein RIE31_05080 [Alphaproteobacteria bacterium]